jgi:TonB family protein
VRRRGGLHFGPALRRLRLPLRPTVISVAFHGVFVAAALWGNSVWGDSETKTVYVNLVSVVAAVGQPQAVPALPPRPADLPAPAARPSPAELPQREPSREPPRELPARDRSRDALGLPDPSLPPQRAPSLPRPDDRDLPRLASTPAPPPPPPAPAAPPRPAAAAPPPVGQPTGVSQGVGALTLNVSDFPYAWYIAAIHRKIRERWDGYALAGQQPAVVFEIARDGGLRGIRVDKTSGNPYYDQAAVRAVTEANPFPPLPTDFKKAVLTVGLQFAHDPTATR